MPGSERSQEKSARRFVALLCLLVAGGLAGLAGFNWLVDPADYWGNGGKYGFNRHNPENLFYFRQENLPGYVAGLIDGWHDTYLVGTSRVRLGFGRCSHPAVAKIPFRGGDARQMAAAGNEILDHARSPYTVILEISGMEGSGNITGDGGASQARQTTQITQALRFLLSYDATKASLAKVVFNMRASGRDMGERGLAMPDSGADVATECAGFDQSGDTPRDAVGDYILLDQWRKTARAQSGVFDQLVAVYQQALADAENTCFRQGIRHRIIWVSFPYSPQVRGDQVIATEIGRWNRAFAIAFAAPRAHRGACDIAHVNFNGDMTQGGSGAVDGIAGADDWYDVFHFREDVGQRILDRMMGRVSDR